MPVTLAAVRTDTRSHLDEVTAAFWSDAELNTWINEAARDIARRAEDIQSFNSAMAAVPNVAKYQLPSDVIRMHRIEYVPFSGTQTYPVQLTTYQELDQQWGVIQTQQRSYPSWACFWGMPGNVTSPLTVQFFPVPSQAGNFNLFYYRLPVNAVADTDTLEVPEGWHDLIPLYAEWTAKRKDLDPTWEEAKKLYEERLVSLIDVSRNWHDQAQAVTVGTGNIPNWLYSFDG